MGKNLKKDIYTHIYKNICIYYKNIIILISYSYIYKNIYTYI